ncbi:hypothetical protein ILUMI_10124 [Ignelater luminosus]|uniref:DUF659 domain-containing protein n=1 Tax=Ignelater luminosus TaxID=2038154 RepID=A0A8K0GDX3_IGNLU|nr:hypothetical protein ILUMI_10124 [Ignelater luminosus]
MTNFYRQRRLEFTAANLNRDSVKVIFSDEKEEVFAEPFDYPFCTEGLSPSRLPLRLLQPSLRLSPPPRNPPVQPRQLFRRRTSPTPTTATTPTAIMMSFWRPLPPWRPLPARRRSRSPAERPRPARRRPLVSRLLAPGDRPPSLHPPPPPCCPLSPQANPLPTPEFNPPPLEVAEVGKPIHYFKLFFTDELLQHITEQSNFYATQLDANQPLKLTHQQVEVFLDTVNPLFYVITLYIALNGCSLLHDFERSSNAVVENWFNILKNNILDEQLRRKCSRYVGRVREYVVAQHRGYKNEVGKTRRASRKRKAVPEKTWQSKKKREFTIVVGSIIHSDCWATYDGGGISASPVVSPYEHVSVNHSENFVDPETGAYTNHMEAFWKAMTMKFKAMNNTTAKMLPSYLDELMWRQQYGKYSQEAVQIHSNKKRRVDISTSLKSFITKTSVQQKHELDKQIAKAVIATNSSFRCIEHPQVKKAIQLLRPGYIPPSRRMVSTTLLKEVYKEESEKCFGDLCGQSVNLCIDGWSNVHNARVICANVTTEGHSFLYKTIDTSGHPHTSNYLTEIVCDLISSCKDKYNCSATSFVTDNAANMVCMQATVEEKIGTKVITYGCSAHILNLLSNDLEIKILRKTLYI